MYLNIIILERILLYAIEYNFHKFAITIFKSI